MAGLILLIGALLLGNYLCEKRETLVAVEIHYVFTDPPAVSSMEVTVRRRGGTEPVALLSRPSGVDPDTVHHTRLAPGMYDLEITLTADGRARTVSRPIEVRRGAVITVNLKEERP